MTFELSRSVSDWNLPIAHESFYSAQFMNPGRTFLDVGAHVGTWTLRLAPLFSRVICFEPDPRALEALQANIQCAGFTNVSVVPCAVTNRSGRMLLNRYPNPSTNSLMDPSDTKREAEAVIDTFEVETISLDEFCAGAGVADVDFVKVDAEGAEMLIVEGAQRLFAQQRPDFWLELHGLFYTRLRKQLDPIETDVIDGGIRGLSLARHRAEGWPGLPPPDFWVYPHGTSPTAEEMEALRRRHGIQWTAPTSGWLSEGGV